VAAAAAVAVMPFARMPLLPRLPRPLHLIPAPRSVKCQSNIGISSAEEKPSLLLTMMMALFISIPSAAKQGNTIFLTCPTGTLLVYQQPYSVVIGATWTQDSGDEFEPDELNIFDAEDALGFSTPATALSALIAQNAIFTYKGSAFDGQEEATLDYTMNFGQRQGFGSITGFARTGLITLAPSTFFNDGSILGEAHIEKAPNSENSYELSFFGPNAEELAGEVYDRRDDGLLGESEIIFAGKR